MKNKETIRISLRLFAVPHMKNKETIRIPARRSDASAMLTFD